MNASSDPSSVPGPAASDPSAAPPTPTSALAVRRRFTLPPRAEPMVWGKGRFKIDVLLSDADRPAYDALLSSPRTTGTSAWGWLKSRGYKVGLTAVLNHKRQFDRDNEQLRRAARAASAYASAADSLGGPEAFSAAALTKINELAMAHLFPADGSPPARAATTAAVLNELARTIDKTLAARGRLESLRPKLEEARRVQEGHAVADGRAVVERVREILGMPPLPRPSSEEGPR